MYHLLYGIFYLLSLLPLRLLYLFSDFAFVLVYHVFGYRKDVVMKNLEIAFPEKTAKERRSIARKFYRNFTDTFIETIKLLSVSEDWMRRHYVLDPAIFDELYRKGKKCQVHLGHNFNWELANAGMPLYLSYPMLAVYMPINSRPVDRLFRKIRARTGSILIRATRMSIDFAPYRDIQYLLALVADQNPGEPQKGWWGNFFGRPTPFVKGPEKGARTNRTAVVFAQFTKIKRGYYQAHFQLATEDASLLPETALTKTYISYLEEVIRAHPEMWLWSHRRWKHEWKPEYGPVL
jgi:KDO2-lipid IV(A) lauroyltransferase